MTAQSANRPSCPHCNRGPLIPDRDINNCVRSLLCLNCGHRIFRDIDIRHPTATERNIGPGTRSGKRGIPVHTHAGQPAKKG